MKGNYRYSNIILTNIFDINSLGCFSPLHSSTFFTSHKLSRSSLLCRTSKGLFLAGENPLSDECRCRVTWRAVAFDFAPALTLHSRVLKWMFCASVVGRDPGAKWLTQLDLVKSIAFALGFAGHPLWFSAQSVVSTLLGLVSRDVWVSFSEPPFQSLSILVAFLGVHIYTQYISKTFSKSHNKLQRKYKLKNCMFNNRMSLNLIKTQLNFAADFLQKNGNKTKDIRQISSSMFLKLFKKLERSISYQV